MSTAARAEPDLLGALITALAADTTLAALVDTISTALPAAADWPNCALILAEGGGTATFDGWLWRSLIDFHAIAPVSHLSRTLTRTAAAQALASLIALRGSTQGECVISDVATIQRMLWLPDPSFTPARPRFTGQVAVTFHPLT